AATAPGAGVRAGDGRLLISAPHPAEVPSGRGARAATNRHGRATSATHASQWDSLEARDGSTCGRTLPSPVQNVPETMGHGPGDRDHDPLVFLDQFRIPHPGGGDDDVAAAALRRTRPPAVAPHTLGGRSPICRAGTPATIVNGAVSDVTTAPAP